MDNKYRSRKFLISVFVQAVATAALFTGALSGGEFVTISSANIVSYSFANAATYFKNDT